MFLSSLPIGDSKHSAICEYISMVPGMDWLSARDFTFVVSALALRPRRWVEELSLLDAFFDMGVSLNIKLSVSLAGIIFNTESDFK